MNCNYHHQNQVSLICIAPHKCSFYRKLCVECSYEHGVEKNHTVPIKIFQEMVKKFIQSKPQQTSELTLQKKNFKEMLFSTQSKLKQIWDGLEESIKQMYNLIEMEDKFYQNFIKNNMSPTELSNTNLEKLVSIIIGKTLDNMNDQKKSYLKQLEMMKNYWKETQTFCEKFNTELKGIMSFIKKKVSHSQENIQLLKEIKQVYNRKEDFFQVLTQTKYLDGSYLNELLQMLRNKKITNCLEFFKKQTDLKFITSMIQNVSEIDFNKKNYSTENYDQIRKGLIKQITDFQHIIEFLKFLVSLTAIDERFIQCGSNALNLIVEMKVDLREQSFENIRIRDTSLVGGNFVRCNFNGSEFDNVDISGMNLNQAQLFNCKWKNIKLHELNKLDGHSESVYSICYSPDGTTLASSSSDNSIRLWDAKTGQQKAKFDGHSEIVSSICYSPDGTTLASSSYDNSIRLWDVKTGQQKAKLEGHTHYVYSVNFSPDGTTLASGSQDNSFRLWDIQTGQQKAKLDGHSSSVISISYSPDGTTLATGSSDNSIRLWNVKTGEQKAKLDGHSSAVFSICYSPDGSTLASGSADKSILLWDIQTGQFKAKLDGHSDYVRTICYSPDGTTLASGSDDKSIRLWDVKTGQQKAKLDGHSNDINSICCSPDGSTLASCSDDKSIRVWDVRSGQQVLSSYDGYKNILAQFQPSIYSNNVLTQSVTSIVTILLISQQLIFQSQGALILKGELINQKGIDLKALFQQRGSCILDNQIRQQIQQN